MQELRQIRGVVTTYTTLPGLILVAVGLYAAVAGALSILFVRWLYWTIERASSALANIAATLALWLPYVLLVLVLLWIVRYYQHTYGQIQASKQVRSQLLGELLVAGLAYLFCGTLNITYHLAVSVPLLILAAFLLTHWWLFARAQMHFLLLAGLTLILSYLPALNADLYRSAAPDWYYNNINICTGAILVIAGLLSHWQMVRALRHVRESIQATGDFSQRKAEHEQSV